MTKRYKNQSQQNNNLSPKFLYAKTDNQALFIQNYASDKHQLLLGHPGTGKAQPLYSKVLSKEGWITMGDVEVGTIVHSIDGWTKVTNVYPQGIKDNVRIYFKDGGHTDCCTEHLWTVYSSVNSKGNRGPTKHVTITTSEIMDLLDLKSNTEKESGNITIDVPKAVEYSQKEFIIHPYVLGALIGDGGLTTHSLSFTSVDEEIVNKVQNNLPKDIFLKKRTDSISYGIADANSSWANPNVVTRELNNLGLLYKKSQFKFIPSIYLFSSIEQRKELLKGLMDTDGTICKSRGTTSYSTSSKALAEDVRTLVLSLGGKASISKKEPFYTDSFGKRQQGLTNYIVSMLLPDKKDCFSLTRKLKLVKPTQLQQLRRSISHYEVLEPTEMQCISVENPSRLYVTDDYILTHNTYLALHCALLDLHNYPDKYKQIIVIRPPVQGQAIGFTPGTEQEKAAPYENPYAPIVNQVMGRGDAYGLMKQKDIIKFELTTFLRGTTFENTIVILDEFQNCTSAVADTVLTRIGHNSKLIICGDLQQRDLTRYSEKDVEKFLDVVEHMPNMFDIIHFEVQDVVRSGLVAEYIKRKFKTYPEGY
jgi:hypothetical protein